MAVITIGRDPNNQIIINNPHISGSHANLQIDTNGNITLTDYSSNGTVVNGNAINHNSITLQKGDSVLFANLIPLDWTNQNISTNFNSQTPTQHKVKDKLWSWKGRIRRKTYWIRILILNFLSFVLFFGLYGLTIYIYNSDIDNYLIVRHYTELFYLILLYLIFVPFGIIQGVKRMHDIDKSGWYLLIPIYSLILLFTDGTIGNNQYGEDPKDR